MSTELAKTQSNAIAQVPDHIQKLLGDRRGQENIGAADIRPPALRLAQSQSPEIKRNDADYIEGLREGEFYNSLTRKILGEGPLRIVVVNPLGHRHVEFAPMAEGGGVIDFNVPDGDPRTEFYEVVEDGKTIRKKPKATKFYDYLILLVGDDGNGTLMTFSLKGMQLKRAVELNTLIKQVKLPSFAQVFELNSVPEKKNNFDYYGVRIAPAGWSTPELLAQAEDLYEAMQGKKIAVETRAEDAPAKDDDIPF